MTAVTTSPTQINDGTGRHVEVRNSGSVDVVIDPFAAVIRPNATLRFQGERGRAVTARTRSGTSTVTVTVDDTFTSVPSEPARVPAAAPPVRVATSGGWAAADPILGVNEVGVTSDTGEIRVGDGSSHWSDLDTLMAADDIVGANIADGSVTEAKLDAAAVTTAKVADGAVTTDKLDSGVAADLAGDAAFTGAFAGLVGSAVLVTANAAPSDGSLSAGQLALWFDKTNGAGKLMIKAKTTNGTVATGSVSLT